MNTKELREKRAALVRDMNELSSKAATEDRSFTAEEIERYDALDRDQKEFLNKAETLERIERANKLLVPELQSVKIDRSVLTSNDANDGFRTFLLRASGNDHLVRDSWKHAYDRLGYKAGNTLELPVARAQSTTVGEGGYTVNGSFVQGLEKTLVAFGGMRSVANVIRTETGAPISWATVNDTSNMGAIIGENSQISNTSVTFGTATLGAYKFTSLVQPVSLELLQDGAIDVGAYLAEVLGERLARAHNYYFTVGTGITSGSAEPAGVVTGASKGADAAGDDVITYGELVDLYHSVDSAYRNNAVWMMCDSTLAAIKKIVDDESRPLWGPGLNGGESDSIMGKRVIVNNDVESIGAAHKAVLFGDFKKYIIRDVLNVQIRVLQERYIDTGSIGVLALSRNDGVLLNSAAVKYLLMHDD